ncbi:MAG TPA: hypothetical protein VE258_11415, partial [Ktedonobacterales bacterium]|nr:hypothetical protein [Ktedonobacterales bacterium]
MYLRAAEVHGERQQSAARQAQLDLGQRRFDKTRAFELRLDIYREHLAQPLDFPLACSGDGRVCTRFLACQPIERIVNVFQLPVKICRTTQTRDRSGRRQGGIEELTAGLHGGAQERLGIGRRRGGLSLCEGGG